jgi:tight adherence protein B
MNLSLVVTLTFFCTALLVGSVMLVLHDMFFRYRSELRERLNELNGSAKPSADAILFDLKQLAALSASRENAWSHLSNLVKHARLGIGINVLLIISAGGGVLLAGGAYRLTWKWWLSPIGFGIGAVAPFLYVHSRYTGNIRQISQQLPDVFDVMARAVRAGQTVPATIRLVADEFAPPISDEFRHCHEQQNLGISFEAAVRDLPRNLPVMELRILAVALLVQSRSGGNLIELLKNLATMARKRVRMQQRMKALTGEARMQAGILVVLPIVALGAVLVLSPEYAAALLARPWLLAVTAVSELIGALWIRQIVQIDA